MYRIKRPDPVELSSIEQYARESPRQYKAKVIALALFGDVALTFVQILPIALPIGVGLLIINSLYSGAWLYNIAGVAVFCFLLWLTRPGDAVEGVEVTREVAPELFEHLDRIRVQLKVPQQMRVVVNEDFNAGAFEGKGMLGLFGVKRTLILGLPLLCSLSRDDVLAIIAHEYGHFSRRHNLFGHWLYRAREGWIYYAESINVHSSAFTRASAVFADWFVPVFSSFSFVLSRHQEYEADAYAEEVSGAGSCAQALTRVHVYSKVWAEGFRRRIANMQSRNAEAPGDYYQQFELACRLWPRSDLEAWLEAALKTSVDWSDTHPVLADRLRAWRQQPRIGDLSPDSAGKLLLGTSWPKIQDQFNQKWLVGHRVDWRFQHLRSKALDRDMATIDDLALDSPDELQRLLICLRNKKRADPAGVITVLDKIYSRYPDAAEVAIVSGNASLSTRPQGACAQLIKSTDLDASYCLSAYGILADHFSELGKEFEAENYSRRFRGASHFAAKAIELAEDKAKNGEVGVSMINEFAKGIWAQVMGNENFIISGWMFSVEVPVAMRRESGGESRFSYSVHFALLVVNPLESGSNRFDEQELCARYESYMRALLPMNALVICRAVFATLGMPQWVAALFERYPGACCFKK